MICFHCSLVHRVFIPVLCHSLEVPAASHEAPLGSRALFAGNMATSCPSLPGRALVAPLQASNTRRSA